MKKRGTILGGLLLAVVVTGYSVSGTYAKYTSSIDLTDEARVARWELKATDGNNKELQATNEIDLFANSYDWNGKNYVKAVNNTDKVVAPGTKGTYELTLAGNMETRYALNFIVNDTQDIVVYYDITDGKVTNMSTTKTTQAYEYHPLRYTVVYTKDGNEVIKDETKKITNKTAAETKKMLDDYNAYVNAGNDFGPGKMANLGYTISWKWDKQNVIPGLEPTEVDVLDTFAGQHVDEIGNAKFNITISATQVAEDHAEA